MEKRIEEIEKNQDIMLGFIEANTKQISGILDREIIKSTALLLLALSQLLIALRPIIQHLLGN